jgi:hypothetical protein
MRGVADNSGGFPFYARRFCDQGLSHELKAHNIDNGRFLPGGKFQRLDARRFCGVFSRFGK